MKKLIDTIQKLFHISPPISFIPNTELVPLDGKSEDESLLFGTPDAKGLKPSITPTEMEERMDGYCVIGFWGHGSNSYAFQYNRKNSWSELSLRMPYGGWDMDNDAEAKKISDFLTKYFSFEQELINTGDNQKIHIAAFYNMGGGYYELTANGKEPVKYVLSFMDQVTVQKHISELLSDI